MCEKPISNNKWCICVLSGLNGDFPFKARFANTRKVSNKGTIKTPIATAGTDFMAIVGGKILFNSMNFIVKILQTKPITSEPVSPINIRAGAAFHHKNPAQAPTIDAATTLTSRAWLTLMLCFG